MLTCLALAAALSASNVAEIPTLSAKIEAEARALTAETQVTSSLISRIDDFSADAMRLSGLLHVADVGQDMPCIFQGIAKDARRRTAELIAADSQSERDDALMNLHVLMDDAAMIAPIAAIAAQDRAEQSDVAQP
ncbi:MAG: hypothetical protein AB7T59_09405 [Hyphomonadaceae bacterium]